MKLSDLIIEHGPYHPVHHSVSEPGAKWDELRDELIELRRKAEAVDSYEEWRVSGTPGQIPIEHNYRSELQARAAFGTLAERAALRCEPPWSDGPHLHRHRVTVTEWEAVEP